MVETIAGEYRPSKCDAKVQKGVTININRSYTVFYVITQNAMRR